MNDDSLPESNQPESGGATESDVEPDVGSHLSAEATKEIGESEWPLVLREKYDITGYRHAHTILMHDFPETYRQLLDMLLEFTFPYSHVIVGGGGKGLIAQDFDRLLAVSGFREKRVEVAQFIDGKRFESPTHKVDFYKERIAVELEWNNKTEFFDRDLENFRKLHALGVLSVGVIVTRATSLDETFHGIDRLLAQMPFVYTRKNGRTERIASIANQFPPGIADADRIRARIDAGMAGQCPILVFAMKPSVAVDDLTPAMQRATAADRPTISVVEFDE